jgi:hypothetical protein
MRIGLVLGCMLGMSLYPPPGIRSDAGRLSAVQFCSIIFGSSSLIAAAVVLFLTGACYGKNTSNPLLYPLLYRYRMALMTGIAALKGQEFTSSSTLGGQGVAQMIV